jgi:hypothetical protein
VAAFVLRDEGKVEIEPDGFLYNLSGVAMILVERGRLYFEGFGWSSFELFTLLSVVRELKERIYQFISYPVHVCFTSTS